jgi:hypothetical protein
MIFRLQQEHQLSGGYWDIDRNKDIQMDLSLIRMGSICSILEDVQITR